MPFGRWYLKLGVVCCCRWYIAVVVVVVPDGVGRRGVLSIVRTMRRRGAESEARMDNVRRGVVGSQGRERRLRRDGVIRSRKKGTG